MKDLWENISPLDTCLLFIMGEPIDYIYPAVLEERSSHNCRPFHLLLLFPSFVVQRRKKGREPSAFLLFSVYGEINIPLLLVLFLFSWTQSSAMVVAVEQSDCWREKRQRAECEDEGM